VSWLIDTDVISQPAKKKGNPQVVAWLDANMEDCYTSTVVIAQLAYWVRSVEGRRRSLLQTWLSSLQESLEGRILSFNISTAHVWAEQKFLLKQKGQSMPVEDSYIAATARRHGLTIVTGNDKDFRHCGVKVLNPFKAQA
jgi:predicted nucleic acid-binding protein